MTDDTAIVIAIVALRLALPLLIPRFPLAIVAALVLDAADQTILQQLTSVDTTESGPYQGYDKALDIYYLTIAYLSMLLNWTSQGAVRIGRFLFFYRLVGVTLFELFDARWLLLVFPNTFEYFFIAYELVRSRWNPLRLSTRAWLLVAAAIWIFVKLPQEYWIHVAQLDFTDAVRAHPEVAAVLALAVVGLLALLYRLRSRLPAADWSLRIASDPSPVSIDEARRRAARERRLLSLQLVEKVSMLSLICIIFAEVLPGIDATGLQVLLGVSLVVLANAAVSTWYSRRPGSGIEGGARRFAVLLTLNVGFVLLPAAILGGGTLRLGHGLFFAYLIALVVWLYDSFRPVYDVRFSGG